MKKINGRIVNVAVERDVTNKYYVSVVVDEIESVISKITPKSIIGIDLGIKDLIITSNGEKFSKNHELIKREKRIKKITKKVSKTGSK